MKYYTVPSILCVAALALNGVSVTHGAGFGDLLGPLSSVLGGGNSDGGGLTSLLGPINIVGSPIVDVDTRVGSPTTVIDKGSTPKSGLTIVSPSLVRVKTDVDSEKTEILSAPSSNSKSPGLSSLLGNVNLVGSPAVDVGTNVGSPSTVINKPQSGINIVSPSLVRVKTNVDSQTTELYKPAGVRADAGAGVDPDIAMALAPKPRPNSVAALASTLTALFSSGGGGATVPPAPTAAAFVAPPAPARDVARAPTMVPAAPIPTVVTASSLTPVVTIATIGHSSTSPLPQPRAATSTKDAASPAPLT